MDGEGLFKGLDNEGWRGNLLDLRDIYGLYRFRWQEVLRCKGDKEL